MLMKQNKIRRGCQTAAMAPSVYTFKYNSQKCHITNCRSVIEEEWDRLWWLAHPDSHRPVPEVGRNYWLRISQNTVNKSYCLVCNSTNSTNVSAPRTFFKDLEFNYPMKLRFIVFTLPSIIFGKGVSSFVTGFPCDVCGRGWTTCHSMSVYFCRIYSKQVGL